MEDSGWECYPLNAPVIAVSAGTNPDTGFIAGSGGAIFRTRNGGATWTALPTGTSQTIYSLHFIDNAFGYALAGHDTLLITGNGGSAWAPVLLGTQNNLTAVHFPTAASGWAVGANGTIFKLNRAPPVGLIAPAPRRRAAFLRPGSFLGARAFDLRGRIQAGAPPSGPFILELLPATLGRC